MGAFRTAQQRSQERALNQLAETAALEGTSRSGGALSDRLGLEQQRGEAESAFEADLLGREFEGERARLMQALGLASQYGTAQDQLALQDKLAALDAQLRREGLSLQGELGRGDLAVRGETARGQLGLGQGHLDLARLAQAAQERQFGQSLGAQLGQFGAARDDANLRALLGML